MLAYVRVDKDPCGRRCPRVADLSRGGSPAGAGPDRGADRGPARDHGCRPMMQITKAVLHDSWNMRLVIAQNEKEALKKQRKDINRQLENMLDRIVEANSASVVSAYETRIEKLERDKIVLQERIAKSIPSKGRLEDCFELFLKFPSSSWNIRKNGDYVLRQTVLRLAFSEPLRYSRNGGMELPNLLSLSDT